MMKFNEIFRKNVTYDNIKSRQKSGSPLYKKALSLENTIL